VCLGSGHKKGPFDKRAAYIVFLCCSKRGREGRREGGREGGKGSMSKQARAATDQGATRQLKKKEQENKIKGERGERAREGGREGGRERKRIDCCTHMTYIEGMKCEEKEEGKEKQEEEGEEESTFDLFSDFFFKNIPSERRRRGKKG
jgi:hypothetical protein